MSHLHLHVLLLHEGSTRNMWSSQQLIASTTSQTPTKTPPKTFVQGRAIGFYEEE